MLGFLPPGAGLGLECIRGFGKDEVEHFLSRTRLECLDAFADGVGVCLCFGGGVVDEGLVCCAGFEQQGCQPGYGILAAVAALLVEGAVAARIITG